MANSDRSLSEITRLGTRQDVQIRLSSMSNHFLKVCTWITENYKRTERSVTLFNLLSSSSAYLHVAATNLENHGSVLALCTRNLYELNLRVRHVLSSEQNMQSWQAEAFADKIQVLEGILQLETLSDNLEQKSLLRSEINRLQNVVKKYRLPNIKKIPTTSSIAEAVGKTNEYKAHFKLFSKLVHPSSYLVNSYPDAFSSEFERILQIHLQLYAFDLFHRICDDLSVPESVWELKLE
uniref:Uncharacterized protein n=1 Tax=Cyanothece sp. (strain PCC 7425 / ATCC 29141) TaxID=395961 RepID=B8HUC7_CYAP4